MNNEPLHTPDPLWVSQETQTPVPSPTPQKSHKKLRIILIVLAALVLIGGASSAVAYVNAKTVKPCTASETACSAAAALEKLSSDPESLVPAGQKGSVDTAQAIPKASIVKVYPDSWAQAGVNSGTMHVKLYSPWPFATDYLVSMNKEDGHWVVLGTL